MKSNVKKPLSLLLCCALLAGGVGATVYALNGDKQETAPESRLSVPADENPSALVKDETVYVLAGADGGVKKIIVSDWIKNSIGSLSISDKSELTGVENVKGNETYIMDGEHMRVWDAQGNDIYYQGNIEKELPVNLLVSYKLDGRTVSAQELAGKSGKVTIRFDYQNNLYQTVEIDGRQENMCVPFAMLTGLLLDNKVFQNVEVSNGRLINDGDRIAVVGIAFPGLQSNLKLDSEKLSIPDYVEITADVKDFEMTNTVTIATNEIFSRLNMDELDSMDQLTDSLDELTLAMDQLIDGSSRLYDGLCTLLKKSGELVSGINRLADGAAKLKEGAGALDAGAADLLNGAKQLADGLGQLTANNADLNAGAKQVFDSLLDMANAQIAAAGLSVPKLTTENYAKVLSGVIASLDSDLVAEQAQAAALQKVTEAVGAQKDAITAGVAAVVKEQVTAKVEEAVRANVEIQVLASQNLTKEQYETAIQAGVITAGQQAQIAAAVEGQMQSDTVRTMLNAQVDAQMASQEIQHTIALKTEEQMTLLIKQNINSEPVQAQIAAALEQAKAGAASLTALKKQLDSYNAFYQGLNQYTAGVASAKTGADQLNGGAAQIKTGTSELAAGMTELYDGILTLQNGAPALVDGVTELRNGSMKLSDGLKELNEKGVYVLEARK